MKIVTLCNRLSRSSKLRSQSAELLGSTTAVFPTAYSEVSSKNTKKTYLSWLAVKCLVWSHQLFSISAGTNVNKKGYGSISVPKATRIKATREEMLRLL